MRSIHSALAVTVDLDWACEPAIEQTLEHFRADGVPVTVFTTHRSAYISAHLQRLEVGLHPFFAADSSHGADVESVVQHVLALPHNLPAFRCHRFAFSNKSKAGLLAAGLRWSSNLCTDLEVLPPYRDRFGILDLPIFLEDGGYLYRGHPLRLSEGPAASALLVPGLKVIVVHPMHFAVNTPHFEYMVGIKRSYSRAEWNELSGARLEAIRHRGRGIRDLLLELIEHARISGIPLLSLGEAFAGLEQAGFRATHAPAGLPLPN